MHLVSQVVFNYDIGNGFFHNTGNFSGIKELQNAVNEYYTRNDLQSLCVWRIVQIVDMDKPEHSEFRFLTGTQHAKNYKTTEIDRDVLSMHICSKIMYPRDVRKILIKKYGNVLDFDSENLDEKQPICDFYVSEREQYGLRDSKTGAPTKQTIKSVCYRRAEPNEIIVDKKLNQIWPTKTKQPPKELVDLLARNKEKVYTE